MKLFNPDGSMPAGVRMMLETMMRSAAPDMAGDIDVIVQFVRKLDTRLGAIEAQLRILANAGKIENGDDNGQRLGTGICGNQGSIERVGE